MSDEVNVAESASDVKSEKQQKAEAKLEKMQREYSAQAMELGQATFQKKALQEEIQRSEGRINAALRKMTDLNQQASAVRKNANIPVPEGVESNDQASESESVSTAQPN